jgi:dienelactone hydrolase
VVQIHGGPAACDLDAWDEHWAYPTNLLCQRGAFVLKPNYHGSTGYGLAWLESITDGKYCDLEVEDIEKGVDALIARGLVDGKKLGLQGWSNGAILTNQLIARTTRYRAASAGAGTVEYVSDWASCEFGEAFDRYYLGKSPLEDLQLYLKKSPIHQYGKVRTPTVIFFGTEDRVVHPQQGWMQYRAMQQLGKAPVRFVQFPGEKHSLVKLAYRKRKIQEEMAWFDEHLFGKGAPVDSAVKEDSPLAWLLKRQEAKSAGGRYGESVKTTLVPETVRYEGLTVGRFEVTRAQYAAFDAKYAVPAGRENYPANDITQEKARAYCVWLSEITGHRYRLPGEAEAEKLYGKSEPGDNTLDEWAGYPVNPDDAAALRARLAKLKPGALLREVGAARGVGKDALVYDLGGNVAEWTAAGLRGGSADAPADERGRTVEAGPAYRGFRVVRE